MSNDELQELPNAQPAPTEQTDSSTQDENLSQKQAEAEESKDFDYKAALEKERKLREKAEKKVVKLKRQTKAQGEPDEDSDVPDLDARLDAMLEKRLSDIERRAQNREYDRVTAQYSTNDDEAELIQYHLENSVRLTGDPEMDVRRAKLIANEAKIAAQNNELAYSASVRGTVNTRRSISGQKKEVKTEPALTEAEKRFIKAMRG
jgi:hypothetical protein